MIWEILQTRQCSLMLMFLKIVTSINNVFAWNSRKSQKNVFDGNLLLETESSSASSESLTNRPIVSRESP